MNHTVDYLRKILLRDIDLLANEIKQYPTDESMWVVKGAITNPGGNLCLHLCGNLRHFIGEVLGHVEFTRNREAEFADKNIPKTELLRQIHLTRDSVDTALGKMDPSRLGETYPIEVFGEPMTTEYFLIHLAAHLTYHRGQINYHRRLLA